MSNLKDQLEVDIKRFLENIESQNHDDRVLTLRNLFDHHLHLNTCNHLLDDHDLRSIVNGAKGNFSRDAMPIYLGEKKRKVEQSELANLFIIESTISYLNKIDCLKRFAKFDKREDKN